MQILELGKYASPGSREDEFAIILCRSQSRVETSRFPGATQQAIGNALIRLMDKRAQNKELLTIKQVIETIRAMHVMMHGTQVGKLMDDEPTVQARALAAHSIQPADTSTSRTRNGKARMPDSEYIRMIREENLALKNQVKQLKASAEKSKTSDESTNADETAVQKNPDAKRKREQAKKVQPVPIASPPKARVSGFMLSYSNGMEDTDSFDEPSSDSARATAYIARVRVPRIPDTSNIENEKPSDSNILIAAPSPEGVCTRSKR